MIQYLKPKNLIKYYEIKNKGLSSLDWMQHRVFNPMLPRPDLFFVIRITCLIAVRIADYTLS
jgi:hypothetical protein